MSALSCDVTLISVYLCKSQDCVSWWCSHKDKGDTVRDMVRDTVRDTVRDMVRAHIHMSAGLVTHLPQDPHH